MATRRNRSKQSSLPRKHATVTPVSLEVIQAEDGAFRGAPEIAVLVGVYRTRPLGASLAIRLVIRCRVTDRLPCVVALDEPVGNMSARLESDERFVVLALALEEDSGDGLRRLYGALEDPSRLRLWTASDAVPNPSELERWSPEGILAPQAVRVELLIDESEPAQLADPDDYLSASAFTVPVPRQRYDEIWRLSFEDRDRTNQWTATLRFRLDG